MKTRIQMVADLASALQEALIFAFEEGDPVWAEDTILKCVKALKESGHGIPMSITEALNEIMIAEMVQAQVVSAQQKDMVDKFQHTQDFFAYALWMTQQPKECRESIQDYWFWLLSVKEDARRLNGGQQ